MYDDATKQVILKGEKAALLDENIQQKNREIISQDFNILSTALAHQFDINPNFDFCSISTGTNNGEYYNLEQSDRKCIHLRTTKENIKSNRR